MSTRIMWFRRDLRLEDNPALTAAAADGHPVICVFALDTALRAPGVARAWLTQSLEHLRRDLAARHASLHVGRGDTAELIATLSEAANAECVHCSRDRSPEGMREEETVRRALSRQRRDLHVHGGRLLVEPDAIRTANGGPYRVFTPFFRTWRELADPAAPSPAPAVITGATPPPDAIAPAVMPSVTPDPLAYWQTGERGALDRLQRFLDEAAEQYEEDRDRPGVRGTSESSPGLSMGEIAPGRIMREVRAEGADGAETFVRQLAWRDFAHHVLHHSPHLLDTPLRSEFEAFPWRDDPSALAAWQEGRTGFPLVDAGMRQLLATGWMHNRARLVCGSFLTKHLLIPWQRGEEWFRDRLVDHDEAVNAFNWQWVAGSGADAAPYFRIFNPTLQGERFDPGGTYVRTWVPELETLPDRWIHHPWDAPRDVLASATITPGVTYPGPIVEHAEARSRALAAYEAMRISRGR